MGISDSQRSCKSLDSGSPQISGSNLWNLKVLLYMGKDLYRCNEGFGDEDALDYLGRTAGMSSEERSRERYTQTQRRSHEESEEAVCPLRQRLG